MKSCKSLYKLSFSFLFPVEGHSIRQELGSEWYDGSNGSLFISILLHNSEFRILNSEFRIPKFALRISEFGIVKYI